MALSKADIRREVRSRLATLSSAQRTEAASRICERVRDLLPPGLVCVYVPMSDEVDVTGLDEHLAAQGRLVLPRVRGDGLTLHAVGDLTQLVPGPWRLMEPPDSPEVSPGALAAVVVPGRAFDRVGGRIGRGKGHYDRVLPEAGEAVRIGVAFEAQCWPAVPVEPHDVRMDVLVTEGGVFRTGARTLG